MELVLNFVWTMLAALLFGLWLRHAAREGAGRRTQLVALAAIILFLFPAISVTDDLMLAQNPAETDLVQRKGQLHAFTRVAHNSVADLPREFRVELLAALSPIAVPGELPAAVSMIPAASSIQNRPPPAV